MWNKKGGRLNKPTTNSFLFWLAARCNCKAVWDLISTSLALGVSLFSFGAEAETLRGFPLFSTLGGGRREHGWGLCKESLSVSLFHSSFLPLSLLAGWSLTLSCRAGAGAEVVMGTSSPWKALEGDSFFAVNKQPTLPAWSISSLYVSQTLKDSFTSLLPYLPLLPTDLPFCCPLSHILYPSFPPTLCHDTFMQTLSSPPTHTHTQKPLTEHARSKPMKMWSL